ALKSLVMHQKDKLDPVSSAFAVVLRNYNIEFDVALWSQYIAFLFIGIIIANSMRGFLKNMAKFFSAVSGGSALSRPLVLFVTEIMGLYFVSSVLLIHGKLPPQHRGIITDVLGGEIEFHFYQDFYDLIFIASAMLSILVLYAHHTTLGETQVEKMLPLTVHND
ncbi:hypothetical protein CYMTET_17188, partial [Cymbomonas tetramitiformis]